MRSLSFAEARKIVDARQTLGASYSSIAKSNTASRVNLEDAQTQTNYASVQTDSKSVTQQKPIANKKQEKPVRNKSPNKLPEKVISDRLPKGSDDPIKQHNRFICLDEDMGADDDHADRNTNKQGRIIKINTKK